jgi:fibronectin-binding autotransporter adhesin
MNSILSLLRSRFNTAAAALAAVLLATPSANAASATWNGTTDSLWSTTTNWSASPVPGVTNTATFNNAGNGNTSITVGTISLTNITFDTASAAAYTLGTGADTINFATGTTTAVTMNSTVAQNETINANLILGTAVASATTFTNSSTTNLLTLGGNITGGTVGTAAAKTITIAGAGNTAIGGIISNGGGSSVAINKTSTGTLTLSNANTYTGNTTVTGGGTLILGNKAALGTGGLIFQTAVSTLQASTDLSGGNATTNAVTMKKDFTVSGSNNVTLGGEFTQSGASLILTSSLDAGRVLELSGNVFLSENATQRTFAIAGTGNTTISGVIADFGGSSHFAVTNTGVTTLTNANTYTGQTRLGTVGQADAGTLRLSGAAKIIGSLLVVGGTLDLNSTTQTITTFGLGGGTAGSTGNVLIGAGTLNLGGTVTYTSSNNPNGGTISGVGGGVLNLNGTRTFTIGDSTAAANDLTVSAIIADGSGSSGITKGSTGVLALTGANTYTGITTISAAGGTISVSNLKNGGVASSLGMSSNAATNLLLGNATTLAYTGTGDTTDRLFTLTGTANLHGATLEASGSGAINFSNTGALAFTTANQTRTLTLAGTNVGNNILAAALANNGSGATSLTKTGVGTWALSGTNTYTGATTVSDGILTFLNTSAKSASAVTAGAAGTIGLGVGGAGYYSSAQVASLFNGSLAGFTMNATSGVAIDTSAGNFTQTDALTAGRALTKLGANTLTLTAANTYTGTTTVSVGTLLVNNTTGNGTGTGNLSVSSGAILGGSGTIAGAVSVAGTLAPGNSPANLTVNNSVTILDGGTLSMEIAGAVFASGYDRLTMTGAGSVFSLAGTNNLALSLTYSPANNALFFLVDNQGGSALSGVFEKLNGLTTNLADGATFSVPGQDFKISYFGDLGTNSFTGGDDLVIQAVPEPGTWLLLAATGTFFMVMRRRRM